MWYLVYAILSTCKSKETVNAINSNTLPTTVSLLADNTEHYLQVTTKRMT